MQELAWHCPNRFAQAVPVRAALPGGAVSLLLAGSADSQPKFVVPFLVRFAVTVLVQNRQAVMFALPGKGFI